MSEKTPVGRAEDAAETHICDVHQWQEVGNLGLLAKEMLTAAVEDREGLAALFSAHRPVLSIDNDQLEFVGCRCMDNVFISGMEAWETHMADAVARWLTGEAS